MWSTELMLPDPVRHHFIHISQVRKENPKVMPLGRARIQFKLWTSWHQTWRLTQATRLGSLKLVLGPPAGGWLWGIFCIFFSPERPLNNFRRKIWVQHLAPVSRGAVSKLSSFHCILVISAPTWCLHLPAGSSGTSQRATHLLCVRRTEHSAWKAAVVIKQMEGWKTNGGN